MRSTNAVLTLRDAALLQMERELTREEIVMALEYWAESREYHARREANPSLLDGALLLRQAARILRHAPDG